MAQEWRRAIRNEMSLGVLMIDGVHMADHCMVVCYQDSNHGRTSSSKHSDLVPQRPLRPLYLTVDGRRVGEGGRE